jgi:hypothetical protein
MDSFDFPLKNSLIEEICTAVITEIRHQGHSDASGDFLLDHGASIQQRIQDPMIQIHV